MTKENSGIENALDLTPSQEEKKEGFTPEPFDLGEEETKATVKPEETQTGPAVTEETKSQVQDALTKISSFSPEELQALEDSVVIDPDNTVVKLEEINEIANAPDASERTEEIDKIDKSQDSFLNLYSNLLEGILEEPEESISKVDKQKLAAELKESFSFLGKPEERDKGQDLSKSLSAIYKLSESDNISVSSIAKDILGKTFPQFASLTGEKEEEETKLQDQNYDQNQEQNQEEADKSKKPKEKKDDKTTQVLIAGGKFGAALALAIAIPGGAGILPAIIFLVMTRNLGKSKGGKDQNLDENDLSSEISEQAADDYEEMLSQFLGKESEQERGKTHLEEAMKDVVEGAKQEVSGTQKDLEEIRKSLQEQNKNAHSQLMSDSLEQPQSADIEIQDAEQELGQDQEEEKKTADQEVEQTEKRAKTIEELDQLDKEQEAPTISDETSIDSTIPGQEEEKGSSGLQEFSDEDGPSVPLSSADVDAAKEGMEVLQQQDQSSSKTTGSKGTTEQKGSWVSRLFGSGASAKGKSSVGRE